MLLYSLYLVCSTCIWYIVACPQEHQINLHCKDDVEVIQASLKSKYSYGYLCMTIAKINAYKDPKEFKLLNIIGTGSFGKVHRALWRGTFVAAKVIQVQGNEKVLQNELSVYR